MVSGLFTSARSAFQGQHQALATRVEFRVPPASAWYARRAPFSFVAGGTRADSSTLLEHELAMARLGAPWCLYERPMASAGLLVAAWRWANQHSQVLHTADAHGRTVV